MNHDSHAVYLLVGYRAAVFGGDPLRSLLPVHDHGDTAAGESVILSAFSSSPSLSPSLSHSLMVAVEREIY